MEPFKLPAPVTLSLTFFWTTLLKGEEGKDVMGDKSAELVEKARAMFKKYNLLVDVIPEDGKKTPAHTLPYAGGFNENTQDGALKMRIQANEKFYREGRLPVIFCPFEAGRNAPSNGSTLRTPSKVGGANWFLPYTFINIGQIAQDRMTLAHEMGHAAGLAPTNKEIEMHEDDSTNVMAVSKSGKHAGLGRSVLYCCQVAAYSRAYFAAPQLWQPDAKFKKDCKMRKSCRSKFGPNWGLDLPAEDA